MSDTTDVEDVESFAARARAWLAANMPRPPDESRRDPSDDSDEEELRRVARSRRLQRLLYDGGFAGICVPSAYGGQGLTLAHQLAFNEEIADYDYPTETQLPTFTPCLPVILEFGTEDQKNTHIPPMLRGETAWMQLLSEPSGGSDVAAALTTAARDGDEWVLNGSKIWTTGAWWADWGLCLARTNWDVPKHRGLSVFMLDMHQPGIEIHRIEMLNGSREFCQEFLTDVRVPESLRVGAVDGGWTVGVRWMLHERTVLGQSPYVTGEPVRRRLGQGPGGGVAPLLQRARDLGLLTDPKASELIGEVFAMSVVGSTLGSHIAEGIRTGRLAEDAGAITRLYVGTSAVRNASIAFELAGLSAIAWSDSEAELGKRGIDYLMRQAACIGGGTTEMSRNVISERVLGMPRERAFDRDVPFRDVPRSAPQR
ncbi:MAG: acyl-CoA dehydrogenase domain protein [Acidimicrobiales bacterium]|jgi:alkylation response protein AidB-like acyl-CoA dehydrogenase|nr:acyl-CoA dehydrogenase domain protein [Acidimicrobiales bacterium]